ncbi:hypothetical protein [Microvirga massiliensis]|uniref:hypothetical protein n=1 Tax=Microvirga massiliensis TaxID=1033741 RepID=UPI00062B43CF|nr:hypothetical protein [Microvirga massiliensis]
MSPVSARGTMAPDDAHPSDLPPEIQSTLQTLADLEARYGAERDGLGRCPGPNAVKERLLAQLERRHARERQPLVQRLADLQQEMASARMFDGLRLH